jgi:hypothetical protein
MEDYQVSASPAPKRTPWNKGKLIGAKPPLWPKHVWSIRTKLKIEDRIRDLALFNVAIDSKLRECDVVALRSKILLRTDMPPSVRCYARERPAVRSDSN